MRLPIYQIDAFADRVFAGNPAAVIPMDAWLPDETLRAIAAENNLAETAFLISDETGEADYHLRWFTPVIEVDLCGHATLATAHYLLNIAAPDKPSVSFRTRSGILTVTRDGDRLSMDFPAYQTAEREMPGLAEALGVEALASLHSPDEPERDRMILLLADEAAVRAVSPDISALKRFDDVSVCVTAPGDEIDFVSRYFAPNHGIDEDPVTGSNHSILAPYWAERLGKSDLVARQISERGGELRCRVGGGRVEISGRAVLYLKGEIEI
jgi:PhzF family phenazine biosynthesis protein